MWVLLLFLASFVSPQYRGQLSLYTVPANCTVNEYYAPNNYSCTPCPANLTSSADHLSCQCPSGSIVSNFTAAGPTCSQCSAGEVVIAGRCTPCPPGVACTCSPGQILQNNGCSSCPNNFLPNEEQTRCEPCQSLSCLCQNGSCSQGLGEPKTEVFLADGSSVRSIFLENEVQSTIGRCQLGSSQDCQALLNMCVLQHFDRSSWTACTFANRITTYYSNLILSGDTESELHRESAIPTAYSMNQPLPIVAARFHRNGSFLEMSSLSPALLCSFPERSIAMGRRFSQSCALDVTSLLEDDRQVLAELFVRFRDEEGGQRMYPIPILNRQMRANGQYINKDKSSRVELSRRLFLVDNSAQFPNGTGLIRFVSSMELHINLQPTKNGLIFPPLLIVDYSDVSVDSKEVQSSFSVRFNSDPDRHDRDLEITMSVLCPTSVIWAGLQTYSWGRRSGKQLISDATVVIQFVLFSASCLGEVFLLIPSIIAVWLTFAYKTQYYVFYNVLSNSQENTLRVYLLLAVILKGASVVQKMWQLVMQRTIFVDWERPRTVLDQTNRPPSQDISKSFKDLPPVAWRTYMVANEWNELFSYRKTSVTLQLLSMLVLLEHFGWKNWALVEPGFHTSQHGAVEATNLTRLGVFVFVYLAVALVQWIIQVTLLERIIIDPFHNFIDLCSVANISVMSLTHSLYGYYIHGRSVHGRGDASMGEMNDFLKRERDNLCANRGLEPGTELQTFQVALPASFQEKLSNIQSSNVVNTNLRGFEQYTARMDRASQKHELVNNFVKEFIDHSLTDIDYTTREPTLVESLLDVETNDTTFNGHLTRDQSEMAFARCFLYGNEWTFLSFEVALFCSLALWLDSLPLTCFLVFTTSTLTWLFCSLVAKGQLARVSLVDNRFLL